ncbi:BlaI/MecI/CopY family transcriptional regulator [Kitasatospora cathayae]|uniref:BlaI/MecI/CopY family transcriptional regulator n=1 Tax=Kitasatospora cathayae TaxID=3004092 RepID=A0ABY7PXG1_9ACTN|nr:BlaI/MecI/CopY family transcriptional regulator [Kitasatospora sp. HUAS 3-15]WBP85098.1 BlaI/MecI/CopY family transcriptional regulator [Kitasatospora sp. HUAS 3-15]
MRRLGELEAEIMNRIWSWGRPATVRELVDDLTTTRQIAYTTVMTVAEILFHKGHLQRRKDGRVWVYQSVRSREEYTAALMADALTSSPDRSTALARFAEQISPDEQKALRETLEELLRERAE